MATISNDPSGYIDQKALEGEMFGGEKDDRILDAVVSDFCGVSCEAAPWRRAEAHLNMGVEFLQAKEIQQAAMHFKRAQEIGAETDPSPFNQLGAQHLRGLAHLNLGLTYIEQSNRTGTEIDKLRWCRGAAEEFRQAVLIGDCAPQFQRFELDAQRWLANTRNNNKILPDTAALGFDDKKAALQAAILEMLNILDQGEAAKRAGDRPALAKEKSRLEKLQDNVESTAKKESVWEELLKYFPQAKRTLAP